MIDRHHPTNSDVSLDNHAAPSQCSISSPGRAANSLSGAGRRSSWIRGRRLVCLGLSGMQC